MTACGLRQRSFYDANNLATHVFEGRGVDIYPVERTGSLGKSDVFMQPLRKIIGHELDAQPRLDEMMVDGVDASFSQAFYELLHAGGDRIGGQHYDVGSAEIESLFGNLAGVGMMAFEMARDYFDEAFAQIAERRELAHVHASKLFGQAGLITGGQSPVREVVGESLPNEMVLLQGAEGVLKDGILGASAQTIQQLGKGVRLERGDAQEVGRGIEVKRFDCLMRKRGLGSDCVLSCSRHLLSIPYCYRSLSHALIHYVRSLCGISS